MKNNNAIMQSILTAMCICLLFLISMFGYHWWYDNFVEPPSATLSLGGDFSLTSHTGETVHSTDFKGKIRMIYFGYVFCPDICPLSLQLMTTALEKLGPKEDQIQPLFITIDPMRDTVAILRDYVGHFHPRLIALTGSKEEIEAISQAFKVYVQPIPASKLGYPYLIDHSSFIYIMDENGKYLQHFHHTSPVEDVVHYLKHVAK